MYDMKYFIDYSVSKLILISTSYICTYVGMYTIGVYIYMYIYSNMCNIINGISIRRQKCDFKLTVSNHTNNLQ